MKKLWVLLIVGTAALCANAAAPVDETFSSPRLSSDGAWIFEGNVTFSGNPENRRPVMVGGNANGILFSQFKVAKTVELSWIGCLPAGNNTVGLVAPNPQYFGNFAAFSPGPRQISFATDPSQPETLSIYRDSPSGPEFTPIKISKFPNENSYCGKFELIRKGSRVYAKFNGKTVYSGPVYTNNGGIPYGAALSALSVQRAGGNPITFSALSFVAHLE